MKPAGGQTGPLRKSFMNPVCDYHIHTSLCGHAEGEPSQYVRQAVKIGLKEMGFSDHAPLFSHKDPGIAMDHSRLPDYQQRIESVRKEFEDRILVRAGLEADFVPGFEDMTRKMLAGYPYDYVIGSVHFIAEWGFDDPIQRKKWDKKDVDTVYGQYYRLLRESARSCLFDIIGHADLVKKFNYRPSRDPLNEVEENARVFKETGLVVEINSSGLRKPAKEIYPSLAHLKLYRAQGVPITFGSDAHEPGDVGRDFDKSRELALAAGYKEYVTFEKRRIDRTLPL